MEYYSINKLSQLSGLPLTTVHRYLKIFHEILPEGKKIGRTTKYPQDVIKDLKNISMWYDNGKRTPEIEEMLIAGNVEGDAPKHQGALEKISADIQGLTQAINTQTQTLNGVVELLNTAFPPLCQMVEHITKINSQISSTVFQNSFIPQVTHIDNKSGASEVDSENEYPEKVPENNDNIADDVFQSHDKNTNELDTTDFPQDSKIERITEKEEGDKSCKENNTTTIPKKELKDQETAGEISQLKTGTTEISSWEDDSYKEYTKNLIFDFKKKGLSHKKIAEKLTQMNLKTRTGLDKWSRGTVGKILKRERLGG